MKPKIKSGVSVLFRKSGEDNFEVNFLVNKSDSVYPFNFNQDSFQILKLCNGKNSPREIAKLTVLKQEEVKFLFDLLKSKSLMIDADEEIGESEVSNPQLNFLASFAQRCNSAKEMQARICSGHVLIIGLGGIGTWVIKSLLLAGVKHFTVIDPDTVESTNLNRQCLYFIEDVGKNKADLVQKVILASTPSATCKVRYKKIHQTVDLTNELKGIDLVINCADEPSTEKVNRIVTRACYQKRIPHILCGGYDGHLGFVGPTIVPPISPCWFCYEKCLDTGLKKAGYKHLLITDEDEKGGNIAPISSVVGNLHALEAIKVLSGFAEPALLSSTLEIDFLRFENHHRTFFKTKGCKFCSI